MGTELLTQSRKKLHIMKRVFAREKFIESCRHESFKKYSAFWSRSVFMLRNAYSEHELLP